MEDLRYPIGKFRWPKRITADDRQGWIAEIAAAPQKVREAIAGLDDEQLDTPYRPEGWTVRQVAHHIVDSHLNAYVRMRLALTEDNPSIRPYDEKRWAELKDAAGDPPEPSLRLLEALHERWISLSESIPETGMRRTFYHPELEAKVSIESLLAMYAWHGKHHVAHITNLRQRMDW